MSPSRPHISVGPIETEKDKKTGKQKTVAYWNSGQEMLSPTTEAGLRELLDQLRQTGS